MQSNKYPQPLYARAVRAYLQEFCDKHGYDMKEVQEHGAPYPLYDFGESLCNISLDDIRIDIDGFYLHDGRYVEIDAEAIHEWYLGGSGYNYWHWLMMNKL